MATTYQINFLDKNGKTLRSMTFTDEQQRDDLYDSIDSINHHLAPAGAVKVEKEKTEPISLYRQQPRRSVISGRYKGGAY